jgi:hypothetical protein
LNSSTMQTSRWLKRIDITLPAIVGILGIVYMLGKSEANPYPSPLQLQIYLSILALSAAALAAVVPGLFNVTRKAPGMAVRIVVAIVVFAVIFFSERAHLLIASKLHVDLKPPAVAIGDRPSVQSLIPQAPTPQYFKAENGDVFVQDGSTWREDSPFDKNHQTFVEYARNERELILLDKRRLMYLRFPFPSGVAQWRFFHESSWTNWIPATYFKGAQPPTN